MPLSELPPAPTESTGDELPLIKTPLPGPRARALTEKLGKLENPAFQKRRDARKEAADGADMGPIVLSRGLGSNVWDTDDNRYVDLAAGFGAVALGHGASAIERAVSAQSERLVQGLGDLYATEPKIALLERLAKLHPGAAGKGEGGGEPARVMLATSGAEAVTAAIKTACLATGKPGVIAFEGAYHGLSYAPLSACGYKESYRAPFAAQLNPHVSFAPYPSDAPTLEASLAAVDAALATGNVGAVLVEPILGRGGLVVPPAGFLAALADRAHAHGALLIADEVWTGVGRSGAVVLSARETAADIVVLGKALGGGLPIAACLVTESIAEAWAQGGEVVHTSTHAGWPLACAAAIAVLDTVRFRKLDERAEAVGARFMSRLTERLEGAPGFVAVRGRGMIVGVELASGTLGLRALRGWLQQGFIATTAGGTHHVLVATPPLTIDESLLDAAATALREVLDGLDAA